MLRSKRKAFAEAKPALKAQGICRRPCVPTQGLFVGRY
jgi:hypothetical protein